MVTIKSEKECRHHKKILLAILTVSSFLFTFFVPAASAQIDLGMNFAASFGLPSDDIRILISGLIRSLL